MKRALTIAAMALLAGCSHEQAASSSTTAPPTAGAGSSTADQTAVIQPSDLSPEQMRLIQRSLSDRGFAVDLSGTFDTPTQTALMDFQRTRGLPSTGNLNQPTIDALGIDPRDVMPVRGPAETPSGTGTMGPPPPSSTPTQ